jgi:putative hydrolase of the HAD superfamily
MIELVGFDADDTLWRSEDYFQAAQAEFERILGQYVDLADARVHDCLLETERRNVKLFGYGAKGMTLSMVETAIVATGERISARDLHRLVALGKEILAHPVELLPGVCEAVAQVAARYRLVLITKGDLFHQEAKIAASGLAGQFTRIEIVSEKDPPAYARVLRECGVPAAHFCMVGNSMRSDIEPVVRLGGWGVHVPYHLTWAYEAEHGLGEDSARVLSVPDAAAVPAALSELSARGTARV